MPATGQSDQHGKVTASEVTFIDGEPVFIVRASDSGAVPGLISYARVLQEKDREVEADAAFDAAMTMSEWQRDNPEKVHTTTEPRGGKNAKS